jgi:hypothetical protein
MLEIRESFGRAGVVGPRTLTPCSPWAANPAGVGGSISRAVSLCLPAFAATARTASVYGHWFEHELTVSTLR